MRTRWVDAMKQGEADASEWLPDEVPYSLSYVWEWFRELHIGRHFGVNGAQPISYQDLLAWSQLTDRKLTQFEITVFRKLDQRYFYVLRTPNGVAPQFFESGQNSAEQQVAAALRSMIARSKKSDSAGVAPLTAPKPKVSSVPVVIRKKANG